MFSNLVVLGFILTGLSLCSALPTKEEKPKSVAPKITYSKETEATTGEDVNLDCAVEGVDLTGIDAFEVRWSKVTDVDGHETVLALSANEKLLLLTDKIKVVHPKDTYQYTLILEQVTEEDSGIYRCTVDFGENQKIDANVPFTVKVPAYFIDESTKMIKVAEGDAISIDCQPGGSPEPKVFWQRVTDDDIPYYSGPLTESNQLDLPRIQRSEAGNYKCFADNGLSDPVSSEIVLEVEYKPTVKADMTVIDASVFAEISMLCKADGNPRPEFIWLKGTQPVISSANYRVLHKYDKESDEVTSSFTILSAQPEDFGNYTCGAANSVGQSDMLIKVNLKSPPVIVKESKTEKIFEAEANPRGRDALPIALECEASGSPSPTYRWTKDGESLLWEADPRMSLEYGTGTLLIQFPSMKDNGVYQCFAYNELGMAASSPVTLTNSTRIDFIRNEPGTVTYEAELGRPFRLACPKVTGYPKPDLFWMKARQVPEGIQMEYINSERMTLDDNGTLWITHITKDDDTEINKFEYVCLASTDLHPEDISLAKTIKLKTIVPEDGQHNVNDDMVNVESFAMYTSPPEVKFKTGQENSLWCIYGGEPVPAVHWARMDGKEIDVTRLSVKNNGQTLVFTDTKIEDQGEYQCMSDNRVGTPKVYTIKLDVEIAPQFKEELKDQAQVVKEGTSVTFTCAILGEDISSPSYEWFFNSRSVQIAKGSNKQIQGSDLIIKSVTQADIGNYACKATNKVGQAYGQTSLNVIPRSRIGSVNQAAPSQDIKNLKNDIDKLRDDVQKLTQIVENQAKTSENQKEMNKLLNLIAQAVLPSIDVTPAEAMKKEPSKVPAPLKVK